MLKLLKPKTGESVRENIEEETEKETRSFYTPTKSVTINSTQNNDSNMSRNSHHLLSVAIPRFVGSFAYFTNYFHNDAF